MMLSDLIFLVWDEAAENRSLCSWEGEVLRIKSKSRFLIYFSLEISYKADLSAHVHLVTVTKPT
jgi:hypothetical protein